MRQLTPTFGQELSRTEALADAVGLRLDQLHPDLPPQVVSTGLPALLVPAADAAAVAGARRDAAGVRRACPEAGAADLYLFALTEGGAKARMFDPGIGIGEDPATGSAAGPLGAYLAARGAGGMPGRIAVRQGEDRATERAPGRGPPGRGRVVGHGGRGSPSRGRGRLDIP